MTMYEKQGYLTEDFKLFHIRDFSDKQYDFHYHDFYKMIFFLRGNVTYCIEGKNYELMPRDLVLVSKSEIHRPIISPDSEYERYVLYISSTFLSYDGRLRECFDKAQASHTGVLRISPSESDKLLDILSNAERIMKAQEFGYDLYAKLLVSEALLRISESVHKNGIDFSGKVVFDEKIVQACEYINAHLSEELSIDKLSERFFISKYYFMRLFKEQTGYSVHQYILEKRILYTKRLVEEGEKVTYACIKAGFKDYSTYLRAKKKLSEDYLR